MKISFKDYLLFACLSAAVILCAAELVLRIAFGLPEGIFWDWSTGKNGLYPESARIKMLWGPVPYVLETNSRGFRGPELLPESDETKIRIAALGDSVTDGAFVDNRETSPFLLQEILRKRGMEVEVFDAAHMGGSIDKELAIFKKNVMPFHPEIVVLTFVTNDIAEIWGKSKEDLVAGITEKPETSLANFVLVNTAVGEFVFDSYLKLRFSDYRKAREKAKDFSNRYNIAGGDNYHENSRLFIKRFRDTDGLLLNEPFSEEVLKHIDNYVHALRELKAACDARNIKLLFVYSPAYPQIYDSSASFRIRDILQEKSRQSGISFLDLTPFFQAEGRERVLHLAPLDYHLNPAGNRLLAATIADHLHANFLSVPGLGNPGAKR